jgi:hypothetical protein
MDHRRSVPLLGLRVDKTMGMVGPGPAAFPVYALASRSDEGPWAMFRSTGKTV